MATLWGFTPKQQINSFVRQLGDIGSKRIPRAVQFALNGVAIDASKQAPKTIERSLDRPTPWMMRSFVAVKGNLSEAKGKRTNELESAIKVRDQQSVVGKYLFGDDAKNTRRPGDVGLASKGIYLPVWSNLAKLGIKPTKAGNLPKNALDKIFANSAAGAFSGAPKIFGKKQRQGIWARPERSWVTEKVQGKTDRKRKVNMGLPQLMLVRVPFTRHATILQRPVEKMASKSMSKIGTLLTKELNSELGRRGGLASASARRAQRDARRAKQ